MASSLEQKDMTKAKLPAPKDMWALYRVRWHFLTRLVWQTPTDPEIVHRWLKAREPAVRPPGSRSIDEINEEVIASLERGDGEAPTDYSTLVFQRDEGRLSYRSSTIKAHIKDCSRVLSNQFVGHIDKERAFSTRVANGVYQDERQYWIPIERDGRPVLVSDGQYDKPVHVRTAQGMMNGLKRLEYVDPGCTMQFTLKVLTNAALGKNAIHEDDLHYLFTYGGTHGYAGERSDGEGRYEYEIERLHAEG